MKNKIISHLIVFLIGGLIFGGIAGVAAYSYAASQVTYTPKDTTWNVDNAKDAIDDLKTKVKPEYTGLTTITPNTNSQTLYTNNKILNSNIVVEPIPSSYKNLSIQTDVAENNLLRGIKAYTNDGTLVTGNLSTTCVSGIYTKPANSQISIDVGFEPTKFLLSYDLGNNPNEILYDSSINDDTYMVTSNYSSVSNYSSEYYKTSNGITTNIPTSKLRYTYSYNVYYMACK